MPITAEPDLFAQIKDFLTNAGGEANGVQTLPRVMGEILDKSFISAAEALGEAEEIAATDATLAAAAGLSSGVEVVLLLVLIAIVFTILFIEGALTNPLKAIPSWVGGGRVVALVETAFSPVHAMGDGLEHALSGAIGRTLQGWITFVHWATIQGSGTSPSAVESEVRHLLEPTRSEIDSLTAAVNLLQGVVEGVVGVPLQHSGGAAPATGSTAARLRALEARNNHQGEEISQLNQRMSLVASRLTTIASQVEHLTATLYGARASVTGVQDLVHQIDILQQTVQTTQGDIEATLQTHTDALAQLAPLASLLYLGERGLQNLRTLEDNMCQCLALPRFGFQIPDLLAIEQVIANGI